jgi:hypothetical protein
MTRPHLLWYAALAVAALAVAHALYGFIEGPSAERWAERFYFSAMGVAALTLILWGTLGPTHDDIDDGDTQMPSADELRARMGRGEPLPRDVNPSASFPAPADVIRAIDEAERQTAEAIMREEHARAVNEQPIDAWRPERTVGTGLHSEVV